MIIFIGKQGSGKGTQAKIASEKMGMKHISTGDLFRNLEGEMKEKVDNYMKEGKLIPDELVVQILKQEISDEEKVILDGFPRNLSQAKTLDNFMKVDKVIEIYISDDEAVKRLEGRRNCKKCGKNYNIVTAPKPKEDELCDKCKIKLEKRADDEETAIRKRLETYKEKTKPVIEYYKNKENVKFYRVDGEKSIEEVSEEMLEKL